MGSGGPVACGVGVLSAVVAKNKLFKFTQSNSTKNKS